MGVFSMKKFLGTLAYCTFFLLIACKTELDTEIVNCNNSCASPTSYCKASTNICVECLSRDNCTAGKIYSNSNKCTSTVDSDEVKSMIYISTVESTGSSTKIGFEFRRSPVNDLIGKSISDISYCLNYKLFDSATFNILGNNDLVEINDFNCTNNWKNFDNIEKSITFNNDKNVILNIVAKSDSNQYLYRRLFLKPNITILPVTSTCSDLLNSFENDRSLVISGPINCLNETITTSDKAYSNFYLNGNGYTINNVLVTNTNTHELYWPAGFVLGLADSYVSNLSLTVSSNYSNVTVYGSLASSIGNSLVENVNIEGYIVSTYSGIGYIGGIIGQVTANSLIADSSYSGSISVSNAANQGFYVGGIASSLDFSTISNSSFSGTINTSGSNIGTIVGGISSINSNESLINNSYSIGVISVPSINLTVAGIAGSLNYGSKIEKTYSTIKINSGSNITKKGCIAGFVNENSIIATSYCLEEINHFDGVTLLNVSQFADAANFTGFDFTNVWKMSTNAQNPDFNRPHLMFESLE